MCVCIHIYVWVHVYIAHLKLRVHHQSKIPIQSIQRCSSLKETYEIVENFIHFLGDCCSVAELCPTLYNPMDCSAPGFPILHYLPEFAQTHVH